MPESNIDFLVKDDISLTMHGFKKVKGYRIGHFALLGMQLDQNLTEFHSRLEIVGNTTFAIDFENVNGPSHMTEFVKGVGQGLAVSASFALKGGFRNAPFVKDRPDVVRFGRIAFHVKDMNFTMRSPIEVLTAFSKVKSSLDPTE
jgi:hypothetical protein